MISGVNLWGSSYNLLNMVTLRTQLLLSCLCLRLLTFDCIVPVLCGPIGSFDDHCGMHSRPYHSSVGRDACQGACFGTVHTSYSQNSAGGSTRMLVRPWATLGTGTACEAREKF